MRGLEGIAAAQLGKIIVRATTEFRGDGADDGLAFDFYFSCGFFLGRASAFEEVG
jgi:hypothetical protein